MSIRSAGQASSMALRGFLIPRHHGPMSGLHRVGKHLTRMVLRNERLHAARYYGVPRKVVRPPYASHVCPHTAQVCDDWKPKAWPYDTTYPSGLPPIPEMPNVGPDNEDLPLRRVPLPDQLPPPPEKALGWFVDTFA